MGKNNKEDEYRHAEAERIRDHLNYDREVLTKEEIKRVGGILSGINAGTADYDTHFMYQKGKYLNELTEEQVDAVTRAARSTSTELQKLANMVVIRGSIDKMNSSITKMFSYTGKTVSEDLRMEYIQQMCMRVIARLPFFERSRGNLGNFVLNEIDYEMQDYSMEKKAQEHGLSMYEYKYMRPVIRVIASLRNDNMEPTDENIIDRAMELRVPMSGFTRSNMEKARNLPQEMTSLHYQKENDDFDTDEIEVASTDMTPEEIATENDTVKRFYHVLKVFDEDDKEMALDMLNIICAGSDDWEEEVAQMYMARHPYVTKRTVNNKIEHIRNVMMFYLPRPDDALDLTELPMMEENPVTSDEYDKAGAELMRSLFLEATTMEMYYDPAWDEEYDADEEIDALFDIPEEFL